MSERTMRVAWMVPSFRPSPNFSFGLCEKSSAVALFVTSSGLASIDNAVFGVAVAITAAGVIFALSGLIPVCPGVGALEVHVETTKGATLTGVPAATDGI